MESPATENTDLNSHPVADGPLPEFVDWLLGAVIALGGLVSIVGGITIVFVVDQELLAESIESGTVTVTLVTTELTEAETLEVSYAVVSWIGIGLLLLGLGMVVFALGYVLLRHRTHRRDRKDEPVSSYGAFAVIGAVATGVVSFIPFSPAVGGALAGYLERGESERTTSVGAIAGLLAVLPVLVVLVFVFGGLVEGLLAIEQTGLLIVVGAVMLLSAMVIATVGAGLGALGGYFGGRFAESRT